MSFERCVRSLCAFASAFVCISLTHSIPLPAHTQTEQVQEPTFSICQSSVCVLCVCVWIWIGETNYSSSVGTSWAARVRWARLFFFLSLSLHCSSLLHKQNVDQCEPFSPLWVHRLLFAGSTFDKRQSSVAITAAAACGEVKLESGKVENGSSELVVGCSRCHRLRVKQNDGRQWRQHTIDWQQQQWNNSKSHASGARTQHNRSYLRQQHW